MITIGKIFVKKEPKEKTKSDKKESKKEKR